MAKVDVELTEAFKSARAQWPLIDLPFDAFLEYVNARSIPLDRTVLRASDLYLAAACSLSHSQAIDTLDTHVIRNAKPAVVRYGPADFVDEVLQRVRVHLLVAEEGSPARIGKFDGRASLRSWVSVCAVRMSLYMLRSQKSRKETHMDWESALLSAASLEGPLAETKARYSEAFREALKHASKSLTPRQRTLLKMRFAHGLSADQIAEAFSVHRVTAWRWLQGAQEALMEAATTSLRGAIPADDVGLQSLLSLVKSHIELSLDALFASTSETEH